MRLILAITTILFSSVSFSLSLNEQRTVFSEAKLLQAQKNWLGAENKMAEIPAYPLTYLLEYQQLKTTFSQDSVESISRFIRDNKQHKISNKLQREYMYYLAGKEYWNEFLTFYPQLPTSSKLKCFYFQAKVELGGADNIWPDVKKTWLSGVSQPSTCDKIFNYYLKQDKISQALIWQRFELAFKTNKKQLMSYLIGLLENESKALAKQLYALNNNPKNLANSDLFTQRDQVSYSFLKVLIKRLARIDVALALQVYENYEEKVPFTFNDEIALKRYFSSRILIKNEQELLPWLNDNLAHLGDVKLIEHRIRYAIKYSNWADIEYWITQLPKETADKTTWVYWQARALEQKKAI